MKRAFLLILLLVPVVVFGQIAVVDGPDLEIDIDSQSSTSLYEGSFTASDDIWADSETMDKYYLYELFEEGSDYPLYTRTYPFPEYDDSIPDVPHTVSITDEDIASVSENGAS